MEEPNYEKDTLENDGLFRYDGRIYAPNNYDLIRLLLDEAHRAPYSSHQGVNKMSAD